MMRGIQPDEEGLLHADAVELPGAVQYEGTGVVYTPKKDVGESIALKWNWIKCVKIEC